MNIKILPNKLNGSVGAIPSKSHAHRLLIAEALSSLGSKSNLVIENSSLDINATKNCLKTLFDTSGNVPVLDCYESGSTLRFLLPVAMALHKKVVFLGSGRLPDRPLSPLKEEMESHGCNFFKSDVGRESREIFTVEGNLTSGTFTLPGNISSQYITGLLLALPLLVGDSKIIITTALESESYVNITLEVLREFGIKITGITDGFHIEGSQSYVHPPHSLCIDGDWSNGAFWYVADVLSKVSGGSNVNCLGLSENSTQGDRKIVEIAKKFEDIFAENMDFKNASSNANRRYIDRANSPKAFSQLTDIEIDASDIPDLVPIISVLASVCPCTTTIKNAGRLRIKESDRLATVSKNLKLLGADIEEFPEGLRIKGVPFLTGNTVSGFNDHRIVMSMAIASIACQGPITIEGFEAVTKSYPSFFKDFTLLGGEVLEF